MRATTWKPPYTAKYIASQIALGVTDADLKKRLKSSYTQLELNSDSFRAAIAQDILYLVNGAFEVPALSRLELISLYDGHLSSERKKKAYKIYLDIRTSTADETCLYCEVAPAKTLDHFVPKSVCPELSIEPYNLIPCCRNCNSEMLAQFSATADGQLFHPLAVPSLGRWLFARAEVLNRRLRVTFFAAPSDSLDATLSNRISNEFDVLSMASTYRTHTSSRIAEIQSNILRGQFRSKREIISYLEGCAGAAFDVDDNSVSGALHEALVESDDFLEDCLSKVGGGQRAPSVKVPRRNTGSKRIIRKRWGD